MSAKPMLSPTQWVDARFIGVYRKPSKPAQRIPVREFEGKHYDMMRREINLAKYVKVG